MEILAIVHFYNILEFQGPYGPLKNSSPCGGHAHYARMASRFARKATLEILDFCLQTHKHTNPQTLQNFIIRFWVWITLILEKSMPALAQKAGTKN